MPGIWAVSRADERATALFAGLGKAFENLAEHNGIEFFASDVIEKTTAWLRMTAMSLMR
jgi:hypothetical protein